MKVRLLWQICAFSLLVSVPCRTTRWVFPVGGYWYTSSVFTCLSPVFDRIPRLSLGFVDGFDDRIAQITQFCHLDDWYVDLYLCQFIDQRRRRFQ